jgi:predicted nucleotidyltransferase
MSTDSPSFDAVGVLQKLDEFGVDYIVIGGIAARLHGSPSVTRDIDICPDRSRDNLDRLANALRSLHARLRGVDDRGPVDVLGDPSGVNGYQSLVANAVQLDLDGTKVLVADIDDLIRMKVAAGRPKDRIEVEILTAIRDHRTED